MPNESGLSAREIELLRSQPAGTGAPPVSGGTLAETPRRLKYGLSVTARGVYDDNININSFNRVSDFYFAIEPSLFFSFGGEDTQGSNSLYFVYRPSAYLFAEHPKRDVIHHLIRLQGQHRFSRLAVSLSQDIRILNGTDLNSLSDPNGHNANTDVGHSARHKIFTTQLSDSYDLSGKLSLTNSASFAVDTYPSALIGSKNFSGNLFINYQPGGKLVFGIGGTGGYNTVDQGSPDQIYEQANVRVSYNATGKISLNATGGVEFREFESNSRGIYVSPVYEVSAIYQPFDGTSVSLVGSRRTQNSASLGGQDYTATDISLSVSQRFVRRFVLGLAVGYDNSSYFSTIQGINATRDDNYYYIQPSVDLTIMRFWTVGAYYLHRQNISSFDFFSFYDNQVGLRTSVTF